MSKAVLISIRPEWVEKILSGEKTVEIRKTCPKLKTPFKCYIYCTFGKATIRSVERDPDSRELIFNRCMAERVDPYRQQMVVAEFTCRAAYKEAYNSDGYGLRNEEAVLKESRLTEGQLYHYLQGRPCFVWKISDLKVYDKPKPFSSFTGQNRFGGAPHKLTRPPQSWCYLEETGD